MKGWNNGLFFLHPPLDGGTPQRGKIREYPPPPTPDHKPLDSRPILVRDSGCQKLKSLDCMDINFQHLCTVVLDKRGPVLPQVEQAIDHFLHGLVSEEASAGWGSTNLMTIYSQRPGVWSQTSSHVREAPE